MLFKLNIFNIFISLYKVYRLLLDLERVLLRCSFLRSFLSSLCERRFLCSECFDDLWCLREVEGPSESESESELDELSDACLFFGFFCFRLLWIFSIFSNFLQDLSSLAWVTELNVLLTLKALSSVWCSEILRIRFLVFSQLLLLRLQAGDSQRTAMLKHSVS